MKRIKNSIMCLVLIISCVMGMTACSGDSEDSSGHIEANMLTSKVSLKKVNFYDFNPDTEKYRANFTESGLYAMSNTLNSTEIWLTGKYDIYVICTDKCLSKKPDKIEVYTNSKKTKSETYKMKY